MQFDVYDNGGETMDRYTIILNGSVYTMSANALAPNGVNMYAGEAEDYRDDWSGTRPDSLPMDVVRAILHRFLAALD